VSRGTRRVSYLIWPVFLVFVAYYFWNLRGDASDDSYRLGDWLINYSQGFIRRGLIGTILISISDLGVSLIWLVFATQVGFYGLIFFLTQRIYLMRDRGAEWLLLLFSPAFLFFPLYDPWGGFRKEIIVFAAFLILAHAYARREVSRTAILTSLGLFALAAFSHELTGFTLPFFVVVLLRSNRSGLIDRHLARLSIGLFSAVTVLSVALSRAFAGGAEAAAGICNSVVTRGFDNRICDGAIDWLRVGLSGQIHGVVEILPRYLPVYPLLAVVAILPLFTSDWLRKNLMVAAIGLGAIAPLFVIALDWGRWLHIYFFFLFVLVLAESVWQDVKIRSWPIWVLIGYLCVWNLPHVGGTDEPFLGFVQRLIQVISSI
jgi:hypothetical protein